MSQHRCPHSADFLTLSCDPVSSGSDGPSSIWRASGSSITFSGLSSSNARTSLESRKDGKRTAICTARLECSFHAVLSSAIRLSYSLPSELYRSCVVVSDSPLMALYWFVAVGTPASCRSQEDEARRRVASAHSQVADTAAPASPLRTENFPQLSSLLATRLATLTRRRRRVGFQL